MDKKYAIDLQTLEETCDNFAKSMEGYLKTELKYFDYLRTRPKFFLGKKYVHNRIVIGKIPVPKEEAEVKVDLRPRRNQRGRTKTPVRVNQPVRQAEAQEQVAQPAQTPVNVPLALSGAPKTKQTPKAAQVPATAPQVKPPGQQPPTIRPKQPFVPKPPQVPANKIVRSPRTATTKPTVNIRSGLPTGNKIGLAAILGGQALQEFENKKAEERANQLLDLKTKDKAEYKKRLNELRLEAKNEKLIYPVLQLTGAPFVPAAIILKALGELKEEEIPLTIPGQTINLTADLNADGSPINTTEAKSLRELEKQIEETDRKYGVTLNAKGGVPSGPGRALIGERASRKGDELVARVSQMPEITRSIYREIGSVLLGATYSVAYALPHGRSSSRVLNDITQLARTFGMDRISQPEGVGRAAGSMEVFNVEGFQQKLQQVASHKEIKRRPGSAGTAGEASEQPQEAPQFAPLNIPGGVRIDATGEPGVDFTPDGHYNLVVFPGRVIEWGYQYNPNRVGGDREMGSGYGNYVIIRGSHPQYPNEQFDQLYAHFPSSEVNKYVRPGDTVQRGQVLGLMGTKSHPRSEVGSLTGPHTSLDFLSPNTTSPYPRWRSLVPYVGTGGPGGGQGGLTEFISMSNSQYQQMILNSGLIPESERESTRQYWEEQSKTGSFNLPGLMARFLMSVTDELRFKTDLMFKGLGEGVEFSADFTGSGPSNPKTIFGRIFKGRKLADFADQQITKLFWQKWKPDIFKKLAGANYAGQYFTPDLMTSIKYAGKNGTVIVLPRAQGARGLKNFFGSRISRGFDPTKGIEQFVRTSDVQRLFSQSAAQGRKIVYDLSKAADVEALKKLAKISSKTSPILAKFGRAIPFLGIAAAVYDVQDRIRKGDYGGAALGAISALPGPFGWVGLGAQVAYDMGKTQKPVYRPGGGRQERNLQRSRLNRSVVVPVPVRGSSQVVPMPVRRRNLRGGGSVVISPFNKGSKKK